MEKKIKKKKNEVLIAKHIKIPHRNIEMCE